MSRRWRKGRGFDAHQLQLSWTAPFSQPTGNTGEHGPEPATTPVAAPAEAPATEGDPSNQTPKPPGHSRHPDLVQVLPWDFVHRFPLPLPEAIESGALREEDAEPENIRSLHEEIARKLSSVLVEQDVLTEAQRSGIDPKTRQMPTLAEGRKRLKRFMASERGELERSWQSMIGVYEAAFGPTAADAFAKAIRARHAGIDICAQPDGVPAITVPEEIRHAAESKYHAAESPAIESQGHDRRPRRAKADETHRIVARLPVPRPLADAIAAGHFGVDEQGKPINPSTDEVYAITRDHAEDIIALIQTLRAPGRAATPPLEAEIRAGLAKYAEDFGEQATRQLEAYCRRQARVRDEAPAARGR